MKSVSISIFNGKNYPIFHLKVPVLDQNSINLLVQDFLNRKNATREEGQRKKMSECRKLFQKNSCELFAFPTRQSSLEALACGELFFCSFFQNTGVVLCFFPLIDNFQHHKQRYVATSLFKRINYPEFNDPFTAFLSSNNISFLIFEEGSINTNIDNNCTLSGVKFSVLKYRNGRPTLFCKKTEDRKIAESSILVKEANFSHQTNEKYIFVDCLSAEKGFNISLKFPILTEQAVKEKMLHSQILRSKSLNTTCLNSEIDICQFNIFQTDTNCLLFLPIEISLNLPFSGLTGGKVYFSCKEDKFLQVTVWSDFFESGNKPTFCYTQLYSLWQVDKSDNFFRNSLLSTKISTLQDPDLKLVQVGDFQYLLKNAKMQFIFQNRALGLFFFRTKEPDQSSQARETGPSPSSVQSSTSQTSTCTTDFQIGPPHWSINMPYTQSSPHPQLSLSQTASWMTNPQIGPPHWSINMPYTQSSPHPQLSLSQTSSRMTNPQIGPSQWSINVPYTQSFPHPQLSLSQTSSWMTNPQIGPPQDSMEIPCEQPCAQATPPHSSMQMPPFYTGGLPMQGALDSSQLILEDVNQINEDTWEQLNVILQDVSTESLLENWKDAENGYPCDG